MLASLRGSPVETKDKEIDFKLHEFGYKAGGSPRFFLWVASLDEDVCAFNITEFPQSLPERLKLRPGSLGTSLSVDESYSRNLLGLLPLGEGGKREQRSANQDADNSFVIGSFNPKSAT